jgi:hypothetical protein
MESEVGLLFDHSAKVNRQIQKANPDLKVRRQKKPIH